MLYNTCTSALNAISTTTHPRLQYIKHRPPLWQKNKAVKKNTFTPGIDCIAHTRLLSIEHTHLLENACPQLDMRAITHPRLCLCSCYQAWICQKWKKKYMDRDVVNMNIHFICWGYLLWIMKANEGGFTDVK